MRAPSLLRFTAIASVSLGCASTVQDEGSDDASAIETSDASPNHPGSEGGGATGNMNETGAPTDARPQMDASDACTLGSPVHCGTCDNHCSGPNNEATAPYCSDSTDQGFCSILCKDEHYDLDGVATNGCEATDLPVQDNFSNSVPVILNGTTPENIVGQIYGDGRTHDAPPAARLRGRDDIFRVLSTGSGSRIGACLGITSFPTDNLFEICISDPGAATFVPLGCRTVEPTATSSERCVAPSRFMANATYYVRIRKQAGTNTPNQYALYVAQSL